jgi:NTP pyrophosphatase (non-canonical NTP hydrolase)
VSVPEVAVGDGRIDAFIWQVVAVAFRALEQAQGNGLAQVTLRVLKIGEEYGEAVQAWIGATGLNPRKGITHNRAQVADELGDIAITALVAASSMGFDPRQILAGTAAKVAARFGGPGEQPRSHGLSDAGDDGSVDDFIWEWVSADFRTLDGKDGTDDDEITLRLLKIAEEFGEAAQAWIGVLGQNPRKGVTHSREQVAGELGDVAFGALVTASSMGLDPRLVLAATAAKVGARFGIPAPWSATTPHHVAPPGTPPSGESGSTQAAGRGEPASEDLFSWLLDIAQAQTARYPQRERAPAQVTRLVEAAGALAQQVNAAADAGVATLHDGPLDRARLAAEIVDALQAAAAIAAHYDLTDQVAAAIRDRHARDRDQGLIAATAAVTAGSASAPVPVAESLGT